MKLATVFGATSGQNSTTISPWEVLIMATSLSAAEEVEMKAAPRVQATRRENRGCFMPRTSARPFAAVTRKNCGDADTRWNIHHPQSTNRVQFATVVASRQATRLLRHNRRKLERAFVGRW